MTNLSPGLRTRVAVWLARRVILPEKQGQVVAEIEGADARAMLERVEREAPGRFRLVRDERRATDLLIVVARVAAVVLAVAALLIGGVVALALRAGGQA